MQIPAGLHKTLFISLALFCLLPWISSPLALILGFGFVLCFGNPFQAQVGKVVSSLLKVSVIGLGFGMNLHQSLQSSQDALLLTCFTIALTLTLGFILSRAFGMDRKTGHLISSGTAICGGSAIAAISQVIKADERQISIALGVVFLLNSIALLIFPSIGNLLDLSQQQFGMWCAVSIHDTSSVVGAALVYGEEALSIATTVKLSRVLWIIPLALLSAVFFKDSTQKISIPWFIVLFITAMVLNTYVDLPEKLVQLITFSSKRGMVMCLFLVGSGLSVESIKKSGWKPMLMGSLVWLAISLTSLWYIRFL